MTGRVVVLGSVNRDLVLSVPRHPRPGETLTATALAEYPGGKGANQAVASARAGAPTSLAGAIGTDGFGAAMQEFLSGEGIDLTALTVLPDHPTGLAVIAVDATGQNSILVVPGANAALGAKDTAALDFRPGDLVIAPFEVPDQFLIEGFRRARKAGARTLLNPAPMRAHDPALIGLTDLLVLNETEFALLTGVADVPEGPALAAALAVALPDIPVLVLTRGPDGALVRDQGSIRAVPGHRVAARDTTGAGDCFVGVLAASLALGLDLEAALSRANRAAAISVTRDGAGASMPKAVEIEAFGA
ncbi:ribokinase [Rhabdaerophilum sp. SD176]|uniref:ribokinase n=1 Tax=Rhabdaerophilum sp. SD176 TaxID=2983548 RepID=UPI0024DFE0CD|nr:ribokinase [Rhabdaerophilum sp. SD176]